MKVKKKSVSKKSSAQPNQTSDPGTCTYECLDGQYSLQYDHSNEGFYCENEHGNCNGNGTVTVEAWPYEYEWQIKPVTLPKNAALYRYDSDRKVLRRVRGEWSKGHSTPLEMDLKELAKRAPRVHAIAAAMVKHSAVTTFEIIVPTQKVVTSKKTKASTAKKSSKKVAAKPPSQLAAKKSRPSKKA